MAATRAIDSPESRNWFSQWRAVFVTRRALLPSVKSKAEHLHNNVRQKASSEQTCSSDHSPISDRLPIPCRYHEKLRIEIKTIHKRKKPSWKNASTDTWRDSAFAVAKLFMQPAGYDDKSSFDEIDFNGLAAFIYNCGQFTPNVETLSDEARKYVNMIRHMPDLCSSALTDQATTECIDSMIALLHDPDFHGDPEILEAKKQLDELKTQFHNPNSDLLKYIIEDSAIRGIQEMTELSTTKEGEWIEQASAIKGDIEKLADVLMSSVEKQGESAIYDLKKTFENALAQFDLCINDAKNILIETTEDGILELRDRAQSGKQELEKTTIRGYQELDEKTLEGKQTLFKTCESGTRQIEDATADGRDELLETTICGKGELEDTVKSGKFELSDFIRSEKQTITNEGEQQRKSKLTEAKSHLQKQLLNHYKVKSARINVRLQIDAAVEDIYEEPKLILKNKKDKDGKIIDKEILEMNKMYLSDNGSMVKSIFVQGEAGKGKSAICKKIVHDWCKLKNDGTEETKKENMLSQFEFLFYIRLREVHDKCTIKEMITQNLIKHIGSDYQESETLLSEILKSECCLLLLDGLDEWKHSSNCKLDERIPHVETSWMNCTTLITTRPYKLVELKISRAQLGNHVQLEGVQSPKNLVKRIIKELKKYTLKHCPDTCVEDLKEKGLWHFSDIPIVLAHIVWLWFKNKLQVNMSHSKVYGEMIDERWYEMCDKINNENQEDNELPKEFLDYLSELAFNKLFSTNEDDSIVFRINNGQFERENRKKSLASGILSCSKEMDERPVSYHFMHKTFQEYFSALYLANSGTDLPTHCHHIQEVYTLHRKESVLSLSKLFLFLCGLNIKAAEVFSKTLNTIFTAHCERDGYSDEEAQSFQDMILRGYTEAEMTGNTAAKFCLQHVKFAELPPWPFKKEHEIRRKQNQKLKEFLEKDGTLSNLSSLYIDEKHENYSVFQNKEDSTVLDFETCNNLKFVFLDKVPYEDINQLNLNGLVECRIKFSDYKPAKQLISSFLSSDLIYLKTLTLYNLGWECQAVEIISKLQCVEKLDVTWRESSPNDSQFDLRHLKHLNQLSLQGLNFSDVIILHTLNLRKLALRFKTQKRAPRLMAALLAQGDDSLRLNLDGPRSFLTDVKLKNMLMSAETFRRLVTMVIQSGHSVNCKLEDCTMEPNEAVRQLKVEMENQPALQMVAVQPPSTDYTTHITLLHVTISAEAFRRLVTTVIQSGHSVNCELHGCTIEPNEDVRQLNVEMENQRALQMVAVQPPSTDYTTHIRLVQVTMSAETFRRLVTTVIQSVHSVTCLLQGCTIEPNEDVRQLNVEMENQRALQMVAVQPPSTDYTTHITLHVVTMSAEAFRRLVTTVIQSVHSVNCELHGCTIEPNEDVRQLKVEMENQRALQMVAVQPPSTDYTTHIRLHVVTMSAEAFRRLVTMVIQSGHSVECWLQDCTIEPNEDVRQLKVEMENQPALQMVAVQPPSTDYTTRIRLHKVTMSAEAFRRLITMVIQSGHSVECWLQDCTIEPNEDVRQLKVEMENQRALQMVAVQPPSTDYTTHITLDRVTMSAEAFRRLVTTVIQSVHSVECLLQGCTIEPNEDVRQLNVEMENQRALQMVAVQPPSTDYTTRIRLVQVTMSAEAFRRLVTMVIQSGHSVKCWLEDCTIEPNEDVRQLKVEMENQPALQMVAVQPPSTDYTTRIRLHKVTMSAETFRRLVTTVIQSVHSVTCLLQDCTIEPNEDVRQLNVEMENQRALQMVAVQPTSTDYTTHITLDRVTMSAEAFRRLVTTVIQSGHSVYCLLQDCTIEPNEDVRQLKVEMENLPALKIVIFDHRNIVFNVNVKVPDDDGGDGDDDDDDDDGDDNGDEVNGEPEMSIHGPYSVTSVEPDVTVAAAGNDAPCSDTSVEPDVTVAAAGNDAPCSDSSDTGKKAKMTRFQKVRRFFKNLGGKKSK
ncbi:uncharacterized protein LOC128240500 isoform X3 [Mya arenaria]|uniref:uncharacterized protein LOC128240500 isoform X3 n=1 Tax=Mya arenaria TaxID=6604 RepID=UPI0022E72CBD|nr:uncharacterized protein LOC128240500 isoform X3 [Mya arenaria]